MNFKSPIPGPFGLPIGGRRRAAAPTTGLAAYLALQESLGAVARWKLDETSGTTAVDDIGGYNGTYAPNSGGVWTGGTLGVDGPIAGSKAARFSGAAAEIVAGGAPLVAGSAHATLEAWVHRAALGKQISVGFDNSPTRRWNFVWWSDNLIYCQAEDGVISYPNAYVGLTGWTHVVTAYDGTQAGLSRQTLYVNGAGVGLTAGGGNPAAALASAANLGQMSVGRDTGNNGAPDADASLVALYASTLSAAEVAALYAASGL